ncbi:MAG: glycosyltransferase family 1 protein, partial [Acidobacteriota bacterium]
DVLCGISLRRMARSPYRQLRRMISPLHPRRLRERLMRLAVRLGYNYVRLWVIGLHPRRIAATIRWGRWLRGVLRQRREEKRLTVAVDVSALWEPLTGIGWYLYRLLQHLADRDDVRLRLYGPGFVDKGDVPPPVVELPSGIAIEEVRYTVPEGLSFVHYYLAEKLRRIQERLIAADGNQVLFAPNYFLPTWFDRCEGQLVVTIHDLSFRKVPETLRESTRLDLERHFQQTIGRAARVLTDSETVRGELLESGLVEASRTHAVPLGQGSVAGATPTEPPLGAPRRYALHVGTVEPRKNLPTLLEAWRLLRSQDPAAPDLVLCGRLGWKTESLEEEIAAGEAEGWLVHYGYLPDEQVAALYRDALLVALPSIYEGFGLPAVEAMAAGAPLVCSDIPVLREVAGDAALYAPPDQPQAWAETVRELLGDASRLRTASVRGKERSRRFDWHHAAERTVEVWKEAAHTP